MCKATKQFSTWRFLISQRRCWLRIINYDECPLCPPALLQQLIDKLSASPRKQLILVTGGVGRGNVCMPYDHHGFNDIESEVVSKIAEWITRPADKA